MSYFAAGSAIVAAGTGVYKVLHGAHQENKAKKAIAKQVNPFYNIQNEYYQNANTAGQYAQGGLPQATKDFYGKQSERGLSGGISGILQGGGTPDSISKLFGTYDDSLQRLSTADAQQHLENIKYFRDVNKDLAGQKTIQWANNIKGPHDNLIKQLNAAQVGGQATANEGLGDIISTASSYGTSRQNANLIPKGTTSTPGVSYRQPQATVETIPTAQAPVQMTNTLQPNLLGDNNQALVTGAVNQNPVGLTDEQLYQQYLQSLQTQKGI